jgi:hypothetical protein
MEEKRIHIVYETTVYIGFSYNMYVVSVIEALLL